MRNSFLLFITTFAFLSIGPAARASQYQRFADLSESHRAQLQLQNESTFKIDFTEGLKCTGIFVDDEGRALTSLHCLEDCIVQQKAFSQTAILEWTETDNKTGTHRKMSIGRASPLLTTTTDNKGLHCDARAKLFDGSFYEMKVNVLAVLGPGFLNPRYLIPDLGERAPEISQTLREEGFNAGGDLVLIQLPLPIKNRCVVLSSARSSELTAVYTLGYPYALRKTAGSNAPFDVIGNGDILLFSAGSMSASTEQLHSVLPTLDRETLRFLVPRGTALSSVDAESGGSGSAIFSESGELIGIVQATFNQQQTTYAPWLTRIIDLNQHLPHLLDKVPRNSECSR